MSERTEPSFALTTDDWPDVIQQAIDRLVDANYVVQIDGGDPVWLLRADDVYLVVKEFDGESDVPDDSPNPEWRVNLEQVRTIHII